MNVAWKVNPSIRLTSSAFRNGVLVLLLFLSALYTASIPGTPLHIGDLALVIACVLLLFWGGGFTLSRTAGFFLLWFVWSLLSFLSMKVDGRYPFLSNADFFQSFIRMPFNIIFLLMLAGYAAKSKVYKNLPYLLKWVLLLHAMVQLGIAAMVFSGITSPFNMVLPGQVGRGELLNVFVFRNGFYRFGGLMEEPSWFGWFMVLGMSILFMSELLAKRKILGFIAHIVIGFSILLSFSISAYVSYAMLLFIRYVVFGSSWLRLVVLPLMAFSIIGFWTFVQNAHDSNYLALRVHRMMQGDDTSTNTRFTGSWNKTTLVLHELPLTGTTVGNSDAFIAYISSRVSEDFYNQSALSNQIGFFQPFITTGYIGGFLFLFPMLLLFKRGAHMLFILGIGFVLLTTSAIFVPAFWMLFALGHAIIEHEPNRYRTRLNHGG